VNPYETPRALAEYLLLHYGRPGEVCPFQVVPRETFRFHQRILEECLLPVGPRRGAPTRALDIGCAVGRLTFELARVVDAATGVDSSRRFIRAARRIGRERALRVRIREQGREDASRLVRLPRALWRGNAAFRVGDALDAGAGLRPPFEVVTAVNLICRLRDPRRFLAQLPGLVARGGQLVIGSPHTWLEQYTPPDKWLRPREMTALLRPWFRLVRQCDLPFLIREHRRKYQLVISQISVFVKRD
jgi:SAM-dependent methyltransferase